MQQPDATQQPTELQQPEGTQQTIGRQQVVGIQQPGETQHAVVLPVSEVVGCIILLLTFALFAAERQPLPNKQTKLVEKGRSKMG